MKKLSSYSNKYTWLFSLVLSLLVTTQLVISGYKEYLPAILNKSSEAFVLSDRIIMAFLPLIPWFTIATVCSIFLFLLINFLLLIVNKIYE